MSSLIIGPVKEQMTFLIQSAELIANTTQELISPFSGYIDSFDLVVNKAITTGGTATLNGGGAVYNLQSYLDTSSFPGAAQGDTLYLPGVNTITINSWTASAPTAPGYCNEPNHGLSPGQPVKAGGTLPTGFSSGTIYYVSAYGFSANNFNLATSVANALSGVSITGSGSSSTAGTLQTGSQGIIPVTNCAIAVASSAAAGTEYSASVPNGDPTNAVIAGQLLTISLASFATAGELNGIIWFRSNR